MPKEEYGWAGGNVPIIGDHSLAKHRILRQYVQKYVEILTGNPRIDRFQLALVDGFASGGIYQREGQAEPHLGSPAILIESIAAAKRVVDEARRNPIRLEASYYFVEMNPANIVVSTARSGRACIMLAAFSGALEHRRNQRKSPREHVAVEDGRLAPLGALSTSM